MKKILFLAIILFFINETKSQCDFIIGKVYLPADQICTIENYESIVVSLIDSINFDVVAVDTVNEFGYFVFDVNIISEGKYKIIATDNEEIVSYEDYSLLSQFLNNENTVIKLYCIPLLRSGNLDNNNSNRANNKSEQEFHDIENVDNKLITKQIIDDNQIQLFPNPAGTVLYIQVSDLSEYTTVEIYNIKGQRIFMQTIGAYINEINISNLKSGNYIVKVNSNKGNHISKIFEKK